MKRLKNVWAIAERADAVKELCMGAITLGEKSTLIWAGDKKDAVGCDKVYYLGDLTNGRIFEHYFPTILHLIKTEKPNLILVQASKKGRLLAGIIAAAVGTSVLADITELVLSEKIETKRMVYGGAAIRTEHTAGEVVVACVGSGIFEAREIISSSLVVQVPLVDLPENIKCIEKRAKEGETVNLAAAKKIVGVGRGFTAEEDIQLAEKLAAAIGAEMACTRPIAEEEKWMDKSRYIGISGAMTKPEIYFGIGISGQIQHMVGVNAARTIVAINNDKNAQIFKNCDYGIVGDLKDILPALTDKFTSNA